MGMTCLDMTIIQEEHMLRLFLCTFTDFENDFLPNKINLIRNNGEAQEVIE